MPEKFNPGDVEEFVGGVAPDSGADEITARFIEKYKKNPEYHFEAEEAARILAVLGINARDYGMPDAQSLLEHWQACIADLDEAAPNGTNGPARGKEDVGAGLALTRDEPE